MTKEEAAKACPIATAFVKQMREVFGNGIQVLYVSENGHRFGRAPEQSKEDGNETVSTD